MAGTEVGRRKAMNNAVLKEDFSLKDEKSDPFPRSGRILRRYGFAVLFVMVAFAIRYAMTPVLGEELPFMLFIAAALIAAWYGGAASGIVAINSIKGNSSPR